MSGLSFLFLGAGGVGGYYAGALARSGHRVAVLARNAHLDRIRERGLEIRTPEERYTAGVAAAGSVEELGAEADFAVVAVKSYALDAIAPAARAAARAGATVVPLLNGVDIVDRLATAGVPRDSMLAGLTYISAERVAPGVIVRHSPFVRVVVGEPEGGLSDRARTAAAAFADAGADAEATADATAELWKKFLFLCTVSAACGLARATVGALRDRAYGPELLERALAETWAVARAEGVELPDGTPAGVSERIAALPYDLKPSFVLDVERGGPNELDVLSATVARLARRHELTTPIHDTAVAALTPRAEPAPRRPTPSDPPQ